jgi:hypothetical protein
MGVLGTPSRLFLRERERERSEKNGEGEREVRKMVKGREK